MPLTSTTFFGFRLKIRPAVWNRKYVQYSVCICTSVPVPHKSLFASALFALLLVGLLIGHQVLNIECLSPARLNGFLPATSTCMCMYVYVCTSILLQQQQQHSRPQLHIYFIFYDTRICVGTLTACVLLASSCLSMLLVCPARSW